MKLSYRLLDVALAVLLRCCGCVRYAAAVEAKQRRGGSGGRGGRGGLSDGGETSGGECGDGGDGADRGDGADGGDGADRDQGGGDQGGGEWARLSSPLWRSRPAPYGGNGGLGGGLGGFSPPHRRSGGWGGGGLGGGGAEYGFTTLAACSRGVCAELDIAMAGLHARLQVTEGG